MSGAAPVNDRVYFWIRWLAVIPCALLATIIVQIGSEVVFRYVLVAVWSGSLIVRSFDDGNSAWLLAMGVCGVLGGLLAFVLARRFSLS